MHHRLRTLLILLLAAGVITTLWSLSVCGGLVWMYGPSRSVSQVKAIHARVTGKPLVDDFVFKSLFSRSYTTSLDAVVEDKQVVLRLGDPVEPENDTEFFYRVGRGALNRDGETLEFYVKGSQQSAVVRVEAAAVSKRVWDIQVKKITVKPSDGSQIDVAPPTAAAAMGIEE